VEKNLPRIQAELASHQFLFVIGAPRSGTTLLKMLLTLHPDVAAINASDVRNNEGKRFIMSS
jgi:hypothetical protein